MASYSPKDRLYYVAIAIYIYSFDIFPSLLLIVSSLTACRHCHSRGNGERRGVTTSVANGHASASSYWRDIKLKGKRILSPWARNDNEVHTDVISGSPLPIWLRCHRQRRLLLRFFQLSERRLISTSGHVYCRHAHTEIIYGFIQ